MTNLVTVQDPKGDFYEVSNQNANDLVQHKGWTRVSNTIIKKPDALPVDEPVSEQVMPKEPVNENERTEEPDTSTPIIETEPSVDYDSMTKKALVAYATFKFKKDLDLSDKKDELISQIEKLAADE